MDGQDGQDKKGAGEPTALNRGHTRRGGWRANRRRFEYARQCLDFLRGL